ncbi:hypothetical protein QYE76_063521 [Lolium multiflorum]|uniref:Transposase (putative) gypsy type domain-containing protein n=1 Tax=Lolium multiflorum TaxID=4521 RepID=A0AAD8S6B9_LOLMU|nr:hypothetical protein QYE76_063521 [Lolium multiflorum]
MAAADLGTAEWERSKVTNQDVNLLKRLGLMKKEDAIRFPSEESYPNPPMEYRVSFVDHLIRGLSTPIHDFLRGLLFVYGIQLHQLTPNSILHISIFITLCECFLGITPNWILWKRIFCLRRNGSHSTTYNIGGVVICVRTDVDYFDVEFPDSVQGWRRRWLYIHEEDANSVEHNIVPFDGSAKIQRRHSWDAEASEEERKATEALMTRIHELQNTRGKELSGVQIIAYFLRIRVQPLQARKNPLWTYAGENDANRLSKDLAVKDLEKLVRKITSLNKKDPIPSSCRVKPYSSTNPLPKNHPSMDSLPPLPEGGDVEERAIVTDDNQEAPSFVNEPADSRKSAGSVEKDAASEDTTSAQTPPPAVSPKNKRKRNDVEDSGTSQPKETALSPQKAAYDPYLASLITRTAQEFQLEEPANDPLLDALSFLEVHGSEAREGIDQAKAGLSRLFPYFFPKKEEPATFLNLAKCFNPSEDLGLRVRHENMKVAVENTVALVADSQQSIDWAKVGDTDQIEQSRWKSLIKAAKPNTKKILAYIGIKPSSTPSSSKPEV